MTTDLLDRVRETEQQTKQQRAELFRLLIARVVAETDSTPDEVLADLERCGRTTTELAEAVSERKRRDALRAQVAAGEVEAERAEINAKQQAAKAELNAAQEKHDATVTPLHYRLQDLHQLELQAAEAKRQLYQGCKDEAILARGRELAARVGSIEAKRKELADRIDRLKATVGRDRGNWARDYGALGKPEPAELASQVERLKALEAEAGELWRQQNDVLAAIQQNDQARVDA